MATSVRIGETAKEKLDELHEKFKEESRYSLSKREAIDVIIEDRYEEELG